MKKPLSFRLAGICLMHLLFAAQGQAQCGATGNGTQCQGPLVIVPPSNPSVQEFITLTDIGKPVPGPAATQYTLSISGGAIVESDDGGAYHTLVGATGPAATVQVGSTTTGQPGTAASVSNSGTSSAAVLNFVIPAGVAGQNGPPGQEGQSATVQIGTVTTGAPGSQAAITNSGTPSAAVFNFTIPQGLVGPTIPVDIVLIARSARVQGLDNYWQFPDAETELLDDIVRADVDLTHASQTRLYAEIGGNQPGPPGSVFYAEYSLDGGQTWNVLTGSADVSATGSRVSDWVPVPAEATVDVVVRAVASGGTGGAICIKSVHLQVE
jgi:hypothetical protein